jgi:tripartite-type tricarboxylate transporter receptor subunit TctC
MSEQGFKDIALAEWLGWFLPARTPSNIVQSLNSIVRDGLSSSALVDGLANAGLEPRYATPEQFAALLRQDYDRWAPLVKATGFTAAD